MYIRTVSYALRKEKEMINIESSCSLLNFFLVTMYVLGAGLKQGFE